MKKTLYYFALFFLTALSLNAQAPANDVCSGAQTITPNGNCYAGTTVGSADNWIGTVGCQSANHVEVWYTFVATGSQLSVSVTPGTIGGNLEFILVQATSACSGLSIAGSLCGGAPLTGTINGLQAGSLYYYTISSSGATGTFTTCVNNTTPPPVAGQDCATAAILCSSATFSQSTSAAGFGTQEVSSTNSCWGSGGERQSKWFKFTVGCSGTLEFNINPITNSNDYDWALWNVSTAGCPTSTSAVPTSVACNWSGCKGSTGLSSCPNSEPGVVTSGPGCGGGPAAWSTPITVTAGQTYALLVDNFSTSNTGFNLIFGGACNGGTALIGPSAAFTFTSPSCGAFNFTKSCQTTNSTFFWNFGDGTTSTLQNPSHTYSVSGNFIVTLQVTDALGCTVTSSQTMSVGIPTSNAGPDLALCSVATGTIGAAATAGYSYSWSPSTGLSSGTVSNPSFTLTNTGSSPAITVYTVTTTSSGCTSTDAVSITVNPSPTVTAGPTQSLTCSNTSTVLAGTSSGGSIVWAGPGVTGGGTTTTPTVNTTGIYTISVTNAGCTSTATVTVGQNTIAPTVTATTSNSLNCTVLTSSVIVSTTTSPASYTWSGTGITAGAGTASATVNAAGPYNYTVTDPGNGCFTTGIIAVTQNTTAPGATASVTGSLNCTTTTVTLNGGTTTGNSFNWTGPGGFTSSSQNPTTSVGGTYNFTVINTANSCSSTANVAVTQNTTPPVATAAANGSLNCTNTSVTLNGGPATGVTYSWSGPGGFISTSQNPVVTLGGSYSLVVTSTLNNCPSTQASTTILQSAGLPSVTATPSGSLNCQVTSATIVLSTTSTPVTYTWSGPGLTGSTSNATATVNLGGSYIYTVTNTTNSCAVTGTVSMIQNTVAPIPTATSPGTITCSTTTITLNGGPTSLTYTWTAPAGSSVSTPNQATATGTGAGIYTLTVTNPANACNSSTTLAIPSQTTPPTASIANNPTITCTNTVVTINGGPVTGVTYAWSGPGISGSSTGANVNVTSAGVYSLSVISTSNGCASVPTTVSISANTASPSITMGSNPTIPCSPPTVQITSTVSPGTATVNWSGPNVCGGVNSTTASACAAGIYTLVATNPGNGCSSLSTLTVDPNSGLNVNVINTGTIYCNPSTVQVIASATPATNNTYAWSGPSILSGNGTSSVTVDQAGIYTVVVTNTPTGCSFSYTNTVNADNTPLTIAASTNSVDCISTSANITTTISPAAGTITYSWSNGASSPGISVSPSVNTSYIVTATNTANGCTGTQTINVIADTNPPTGIAVSPNNFTLTCLTTSVTLTGSTTSTASVTYSWSAPGAGFINPGTSTANVSSAGIYTVTVTGTNGCAAMATATVSPNSAAPQFVVSNNSPIITCGPAPTVSISVTSTVPVSYSWTPASGLAGSNTSSVATFTTAGTYTALVTDNNGCSSNSVITVALANTQPVLTAGTDTAQPITCTNTVVTLAPQYTPAADLTYTWAGTGVNGANTPSLQVSQGGTYTVVVTNSVTGCSSFTLITVSGSTVVPTVTVTSSSSLGISCQPGTNTVALTAQSGGNVTYTWSTGANGSAITSSVAGTYTITVADVTSGCTTSATIVVPNNSASPTLNISSSGNIPCGTGGTTSLTASSSNTNVAYTWIGSGIVSGSLTPVVTVNQAGVYSVTAMDAITGCSSSTNISVSQLSLSALAVADVTTGTAPLSVNFTDQGTGATTYTWSFGDGNSSVAFNSSNTYGTPGSYTVILSVSNGACSSSDTVLIKVLESLGEIPEIFTPNGDGRNDVFFIPGLDSYPSTSLQVFNRWGNLVYSAKPYNNDWDGSPNAAGKTGSGKLPGGTYYYLLELGDVNNTVFKGFVQVQY